MSMMCPECHERTGVLSTTPLIVDGEGMVKRYRQCPVCGYRFKTYEIQPKLRMPHLPDAV